MSGCSAVDVKDETRRVNESISYSTSCHGRHVGGRLIQPARRWVDLTEGRERN